MIREKAKERGQGTGGFQEKFFQRKGRFLEKWNPLAVVILWGVLFFHIQAATARELSYLETEEGVRLRIAFYPAQGEAPPFQIVYLPGRGSFIEKNHEKFEKLRGMGFPVWSFDWRWQGGSARHKDVLKKTHVESFNDYLRDVHALIQKKILPENPLPIVLIGSSLGGHIVLRHLMCLPVRYPMCPREDAPGNIAGAALVGAILVAPLLDVRTWPIPRFLVGPMATVACWLGFSKSYAFFQGDPKLPEGDLETDRFFEANRQTHDRLNFLDQIKKCKDNSDLMVGGVTFGWLRALLESVWELKSLSFLGEGDLRKQNPRPTVFGVVLDWLRAAWKPNSPSLQTHPSFPRDPSSPRSSSFLGGVDVASASVPASASLPVLVLEAGDDLVVDNGENEALFSFWGRFSPFLHFEIKKYAGAFHDLFNEKEDVRKQVWGGVLPLF